MARYMLLLRGGDEETQSWSPEQMKDLYQQYFAWSDKLQRDNVLRAADQLKSGGRLVERNGQGIVDGPYAETKEDVGGYFSIETSSYDAAVDIAKGCPILGHGGWVEVRELVDTRDM